MNLREWQGRFLVNFAKAIETGQNDYLLVATPGSGKTVAATSAASILLNGKLIQRVAIVVPTESLKYQWATAAHRCAGLALNPGWTGDAPEGRDFKGVVVTYQSLSSPSQRAMHASLCRRTPTLVIFDEVHHLGEGSWGIGAQQSFTKAAFRLSLSGTPFRSDGVRIPFVRYEPLEDDPEAVQCTPDFSFGYVEALRAKVCRFIYFARRDGEAHWSGRKGEQRAGVGEKINQDLQGERLRAILDAGGEYARTLLMQANEKLSECRATGHAHAGGLVITSDKASAERYKELIESIIGDKAMLVVSNHEEATSIDAFRASSCRWLVAVRMVSEGVDIDRLRVLVYATDYRTELYFRQAVGRVVRMCAGVTNQPAYVFIPDDEQLREWAANIEAEVNQVLREEELKTCGGGGGGGNGGTGSFYVFGTSAALDAGTIGPGVAYTPAEIAEARALRSEFGILSAHEEQIAHMLRSHDARRTGTATAPQPEPEVEPPHQKQERLRRECSRLANRLDKMLERQHGESHLEWIRLDGMKQSEATINDLEQKKQWLIKRISALSDDPRYTGDE